MDEKVLRFGEQARSIRGSRSGKGFHWPEEFKLEARRLVQSGVSLESLSLSSGITRKTLKYWLGGSRSQFKELKIKSDPVEKSQNVFLKLIVVSAAGVRVEVEGLDETRAHEFITRWVKL